MWILLPRPSWHTSSRLSCGQLSSALGLSELSRGCRHKRLIPGRHGGLDAVTWGPHSSSLVATRHGRLLGHRQGKGAMGAPAWQGVLGPVGPYPVPGNDTILWPKELACQAAEPNWAEKEDRKLHPEEPGAWTSTTYSPGDPFLVYRQKPPKMNSGCSIL